GEIYVNYTPTVSLTLNPVVTGADRSQSIGGQDVPATVSLQGAAPAGGAKIRLSSSNAALASGPLSVEIPAGATSANFTVATRAMKARPSVDIVATYQGVSSVATLNVLPPWQPRYFVSLHRDAGSSEPTFDRTFTQQDGQFFGVTFISQNDVPNFVSITFV